MAGLKDVLAGRWSGGGFRRRLAGTAAPGARAASSKEGRSAAATESRLVFLLSAERSGSTVLSLSLGANPQLIVPPEMHLLAYATFEQWQGGYPQALDSLRFVLDACGIDAGDARMADAFRGKAPGEVYRWLLDGRLPEGRMLVDKTPKYARDPAVLTRIEELRPRYIWLVRHPLGVAASQIELRDARRRRRATGLLARLKRPLAELRDRIGRRGVVRAELEYWCRLNSNIEESLAGVDESRWTRVGYERFVTEPEEVLRELSAWLGCPFDAAMLAPGEHVPETINTETGDPKIRQRARIDPSPAYGWRERLSARLLDERTRELMRRWGVAEEPPTDRLDGHPARARVRAPRS